MGGAVQGLEVDDPFLLEVGQLLVNVINLPAFGPYVLRTSDLNGSVA